MPIWIMFLVNFFAVCNAISLGLINLKRKQLVCTISWRAQAWKYKYIIWNCRRLGHALSLILLKCVVSDSSDSLFLFFASFFRPSLLNGYAPAFRVMFFFFLSHLPILTCQHYFAAQHRTFRSSAHAWYIIVYLHEILFFFRFSYLWVRMWVLKTFLSGRGD